MGCSGRLPVRSATKHRWIALAIAAGACARPRGPTPPLEDGPCLPGRVAHVRWFGYYLGAPALAATAAYSNLAWGYAAGYDAAATRAAGAHAVLDVGDVFRISSATPPSADELAARWGAVAGALQPDVDTIAALYPSDEPYWNGARNGVPLDEVAARLEAAARLVHATPGFESVRVATIFSNMELDWIASGRARNPAGYAWVGFDLYGADPATAEARADLFLSLLRPDQRVIAVPDAFLWPSDDPAALDERIAFWLGWIERHDAVVAVAPFIFESEQGWIGAADLPRVRTRYEQIGGCVLAAAAAATTPALARSP